MSTDAEAVAREANAVPRTMLAARQCGPGLMEVDEFPTPAPGPGEVLVRIDRAAICGSDLHSVFDGLGYLNSEDPIPGRPGHEGVGTVVASNSAVFVPGDRVLALGYGAFAQYLTMPASLCARLPADPPSERLVCAQQLGVAVFAMRTFWPHPAPGAVAAVVGSGPVGFMFATLLARTGFETIVASDLSAARLDALRSAVPARTVLAPDESIVDAVMEATGGVGADLVVEAAGYDVTRAQSVRAVRTGGRVGLFGYPESYGDAPFPFGDAFWRSPMSIEIVRNAQADPGLTCFVEAIELVETGAVDINPLLGVCYPLTEINDALDCARGMRALKVQLSLV